MSLFTATAASDGGSVGSKTMLDTELGIAARVGYLLGALQPGETLTVVVTEGLGAAPQEAGA